MFICKDDEVVNLPLHDFFKKDLGNSITFWIGLTSTKFTFANEALRDQAFTIILEAISHDEILLNFDEDDE